jgi:hypothetical protein
LLFHMVPPKWAAGKFVLLETRCANPKARRVRRRTNVGAARGPKQS